MSGNLSDASLKVSQDRQAQALNDIQRLQKMEKSLYEQLEKSSADGTDVQRQEQIVAKINELSAVRMGLFQGLTDMYSQMQNSVAETRVDLVDQMTVVGVVEKELNNAKRSLQELTTAKNNKMRMVEINTYYGKRYQAHAGLMKLLIMVCVPLLILAILRKRNIIPANIANILIGIVTIIGAFMIARRLIDLNSRDNMNYDEYDWGFDPDANDPTVYEYDRAQLEGTDLQKTVTDEASAMAAAVGLGCVGANCCATGTVYDSNKDKCVEAVSTESFQNGRFTQTAFIESDDSCSPWGKSSNVVKPYTPPIPGNGPVQQFATV